VSHPSRDDLTAYALGALDPGEETAVAGHAEGCERCEAELRHLAPAVGVLAESVEQHQPPPELRERLLSIVRAEAAEVEDAAVPRKRGEQWRFGLGGLLLRPAAGLAALAVGAAAVGGYLVAEDGGAEPATTIELGSTLPGASGTIEVEGDTATMHVRGMPALSKGAVYQVWVAEGDSLTPSAAFVPHPDGSATAAVPELPGGASEVLVTREPAPGRTKPTMPSLLEVQVEPS
jgi:hypothetical protein